MEVEVTEFREDMVDPRTGRVLMPDCLFIRAEGKVADGMIVFTAPVFPPETPEVVESMKELAKSIVERQVMQVSAWYN